MTNSKELFNMPRCSEAVTASVLVADIFWLLSRGSPARSSEPPDELPTATSLAPSPNLFPLLRNPAVDCFAHLVQWTIMSLAIPMPRILICVPDAPSKIARSVSNMLKSTAPLICSSMNRSAYSLYLSDRTWLTCASVQLPGMSSMILLRISSQKRNRYPAKSRILFASFSVSGSSSNSCMYRSALL